MMPSDQARDDRAKPHPSERLQARARAADVGWTLSGSVIGCLLAGYLIGEYANANPGAAVAGLVIGIVVGFYNLAKSMGLWK